MKTFLIAFLTIFLLSSCTDEPINLTQFTSPYGGTYAIRLPDQVQVTENTFIYEVKIENLNNDFTEIKRFHFERMNFHPFTPIFAEHQLQYLHFEYYKLPNPQHDKAYQYLAEWEAKVNANPNQFKVTNQITFAICQKQSIDDNKIVTTIFRRLNKDEEFIKVYDNLMPSKNIIMPAIAYQSECL